MPLLINWTSLAQVPDTVSAFVESFPEFKEKASALTESPLETVSGERLLYVFQREYAVVSPAHENVQFIGSEDATTCHIVVIRHSGSGVTGLAHCDGSSTQSVVVSMVTDVLKQSVGGPDGRLECHIVGGFIDPREESVKLTTELLEVLIGCDEDIHLVTACFTDLNDIVKNDVHFPVILGLCVEVQTGRIFPATFPDKGPDADIRGALTFAGYKKYHNVYEPETRELVVGPYTWEPMPYLVYYLNKPDSFIRQHLSTSPEQEPIGFESHVRSALTLLLEHPTPHTSLFPGGKARRYTHTGGTWTKVT